MKAQRIDGKAISDQIKEEAALEAQELQRAGDYPLPCCGFGGQRSRFHGICK